MYKKILIPLGLSELNTSVLDVAFEVASSENANVTLVHVVQTLEGEKKSEADAETNAFYQDIQNKAERHLSQANDYLVERGVSCQAMVLFGDRAAEVMRVAAEQGIDLIIIESHQIHKNDPKEKLGSFSQQLGIFAPCSVLLVR